MTDPKKTAETFVEANGKRWAITGDQAVVEADGTITVLGRGSVSINTGGEKVFPEEVEAALKTHPSVYDCVVAGRPSERWGDEVVAIVRLRDGAGVSAEELRAAAAAHLARFKLPKAIVFVPEIVRSPAGKADYRWAREVAGS